jgi:hypothetical protein
VEGRIATVMDVALIVVCPLTRDAWGTMRGTPDSSREKEPLQLSRQNLRDMAVVQIWTRVLWTCQCLSNIFSTQYIARDLFHPILFVFFQNQNILLNRGILSEL